MTSRDECRELFVPGRLCLFGEHSDWAGELRLRDPSVEPGMCLIAGTDQGIFGRASPHRDRFLLRQIEPDGETGPLRSYPIDPGFLRETAGNGGFDSYAAGTAALIIEEHRTAGLHLDLFRRTLPLKKGLSSSAAVCVLVARAFSLVYNLGLRVEEEMDLAYRGELLTGSVCGRMDQACAFGKERPLLLTFDGDGVDYRVLRPGADFHIAVVDLMGTKDTRRILRDLSNSFKAGDPGLRDALGPINRRILNAACSAVEEGDSRLLGALMTDSQRVFDELVAPACPEELASPGLHRVLGHPSLKEYAWGGKGVGSQGDGTAQVLCRGGDECRLLSEILERELGVWCMEMMISRTV